MSRSNIYRFKKTNSIELTSSAHKNRLLGHFQSADYQLCYNRTKELIGKTNIATPIGSLLKKK